ncbi:O-acetyl-ADP-ribose deacetylase MACROD1 [Selaginella moellendorffii]|uniref:O-acetyl-ADP-ribose deacetylase MACROD1 n=1 Tax=Selaginella moellendorffii TaxID=88036 RepID=UPI000D1CA158|nr:O-acetyl-ADP-ribose deacetylase MACROD1 [Selaginella moellendorffii]|eukprot:XP_002968564.2 O-acetyl-ADP-ribose deacetylase MACROD1 [Selaginella moellendorffii]
MDPVILDLLPDPSSSEDEIEAMPREREMPLSGHANAATRDRVFSGKLPRDRGFSGGNGKIDRDEQHWRQRWEILDKDWRPTKSSASDREARPDAVADGNPGKKKEIRVEEQLESGPAKPRSWSRDASLRSNIMNPFSGGSGARNFVARLEASQGGDASSGYPGSSPYLTWNVRSRAISLPDSRESQSWLEAKPSSFFSKRRREEEEEEEAMAGRKKKAFALFDRFISCKKIPRPRDEAAAAAAYKLTESCKLVLQGGDITIWCKDGHSDAIVNAANERMLGGGGVDGAIHDAAGQELREACRELPLVEPGVRCPVGHAVETPGFELPVARIIHTVGPMYFKSSRVKAAALLRDAYHNSLELAREKGVKFIAFPAISCGIYGCPVDEGAAIALDAVHANAADFEEIHFVLFDGSARKAWFEAADKRFQALDVNA